MSSYLAIKSPKTNENLTFIKANKLNLFFRFISIMYFLNDVSDGQLLFPLANNKTYDWNVSLLFCTAFAITKHSLLSFTDKTEF